MTSHAKERPVFGTKGLYEALAAGLAADPVWATKGRALTMTMTHVYTAPIGRTFFMRFEEGAITEVAELEAAADRPAEYVLTATPEIWERVLVTQTLKANLALVTRKIAVHGKMGWILKNIAAFNHLLSVLTTLDPIVEER
jgi:hypothetical protein